MLIKRGPGEMEPQQGADARLATLFSKHRDEEIEHHDTAVGLGARSTPGCFAIINAVVMAGCAAAIQVAKRI